MLSRQADATFESSARVAGQFFYLSAGKIRIYAGRFHAVETLYSKGLEYLQQADLTTTTPTVTATPHIASAAKRVWSTLWSFVLWSYNRGSIQYDIMVTVILLFIFVTPYFINFNDKPAERTPHPTGVVVLPDGQSGFIYQIPASAVSSGDEAGTRQQLLAIVEPIAGEASITKFEPVKDSSGRVTAYKVWVQR